MNFDITIIGAGIVGLATGYQLLLQNPRLKLCIIEKEEAAAKHQTGHNSGVIHSGIYYKPGSLRAINCQTGYNYLLDFAKANDIPFELCGKVIVATSEEERPYLDTIYKRGIANGMKGIRKISAAETKEKEPHVRSVESIWVPQAGIINYKQVAEKYQERIVEMGGTVFFGHKVHDILSEGNNVTVCTDQKEIQTNLLINCAGLYSDKLAKLSVQQLDIQIVPFRGEYYKLVKDKEYFVNGLIYPVPNPNFPFLGVHFTKMITGGIEAGPNAVLAFKREGYSRWDFDWGELSETLFYPGFQKLALKYWKDGLGELYRSYSKRAFVNALQHLIPEVKSDDLVEGGAGVRAMALAKDGSMIDDYLILEEANIINVCNAPSPAATSSLAIGENIAKKALAKIAVS